jgi:protein-tyrosine phosphatase
MAHGLLLHLCHQHGFGSRIRVDSAGTRVGAKGQRPDQRAQHVMSSRGMDISRLKARPLADEDFHDFDHILAMDTQHLELLTSRCPPEAPVRIDLLMKFARHNQEQEVPDPYYGNEVGFERVAAMLDDAVGGFVDQVIFSEFQAIDLR